MNTNGDFTTHTEIRAADGSFVVVDTFLNDGELHVEVFRGNHFSTADAPIMQGAFTAKVETPTPKQGSIPIAPAVRSALLYNLGLEDLAK